MPRLLLISCLVLVLSSIAWPQKQTAAVTFTLDFPTSQPEHYSIRVQSDGSSHYESSGRLSAESDETESFDLDFRVSDETRQKIFDLAAKANYFQSDVDSHRKGMASTGKKTLSYKDVQRNAESTYNYSTNAAVQALTALMQSLSSTLEFGHRLQYDLRYQKLALEEELKRMEEQAHSSGLPEIATIEPILNQIVADPSVVNVSRARAQRLLEGVPHGH
jgi:hypothetical protein